MTDEIRLSAGQRRALKAVRDGVVYRSQNANGNIIKTPAGIGARCVYWLEKLRLVKEGRRLLELTDAGRRWLWEHPE